MHITTFSTKQLHKVFVICPLTKSEICIRLKCPMKYLLPIYRRSYLYLRKNLALLLLLQELCYWFIFIKGVIVQITINYNFLYPSKIEFDPKLLISFQIRAFQKPCYYYINLIWSKYLWQTFAMMLFLRVILLILILLQFFAKNMTFFLTKFLYNRMQQNSIQTKLAS